MAEFTTHQGSAVVLDQANIDTDQIIPKQFLTSVSRKGYGKHLFHDWRYLDDKGDTLNPEFKLNKPEYAGASILVTRENFGCGSSREHAPWALTDFGFRVIIATSFADIFYGNCLNNQLLPIALNNDTIDTIVDSSEKVLLIDLPAQTITMGDIIINFDIDAVGKEKLIKGLDAIGETLLLSAKIDDFEAAMPRWKR
jgi:3-isopropylmalate/(R)-2-methylmalate dehydratase small subunit